MEVFEDPRNAADSQKFGQHYLNVLQERPNWATPILELDRKKIRLFRNSTREENESIETPFWRQVDIGPKKGIQHYGSWKNELSRFFEGEAG